MILILVSIELYSCISLCMHSSSSRSSLICFLQCNILLFSQVSLCFCSVLYQLFQLVVVSWVLSSNSSSALVGSSSICTPVISKLSFSFSNIVSCPLVKMVRVCVVCVCPGTVVWSTAIAETDVVAFSRSEMFD